MKLNHLWTRRVGLPLALLLLIVGLMNVSAQTSPTPPLTVIRGATQSSPVTPSISDPAGSLPAAPTIDRRAPAVDFPRRMDTGSSALYSGVDYFVIDPLVGSFSVSSSWLQRAFSAPLLNFPGQAYTNVTTSDNIGDVGPNHYIQLVNSPNGARFAIYDKETGSVVQPSTLLNALAPPESLCKVGAAGDPVVLYDQFAQRWLMAEVADEDNNNLPPFALCIYISATSDPQGTWKLYEFETTVFPNYLKIGVWGDAYYATTDEAGTPSRVPAVYALDRTSMLAGTAATFLRIQAPPLPGFGFQTFTPADTDGGVLSPAGAPGLFMRHRDDEVHDMNPNPSQDFIEIWQYDVDFANPGAATFSGPINIQVAEFDSDLCGTTSLQCFDQPGDTSPDLDPLREVIMWRLAYRNFGAYQAMVGNFVTDVDDTDRGGIRWFEVRNGGQAWVLHQEGTVSASDDINRWMGAIAMDKFGNIALGYNIAGPNTFPSIRYTGRLSGDALGQMTQGENEVINGFAANNTFRWGDYNSMNVDPVDDCTFWFTANYSPEPEWSTRISAFRFNACAGGVDATATPQPTSTPGGIPTATATGTPVFTVELIENGGFEQLDTAGKPVISPWIIKFESRDKAKCNKDSDGDGEIDKFFAHTGECAFMFRGVVGERSKLQQKIDVSQDLFAVNDTLTLRVWLDASHPALDATIKLRVKYSDATPKGKINITPTTTTGYQEFDTPSFIQSENVQKIKVQIDHRTQSGKMYVDDVSLEWAWTGQTTRSRTPDGLLPLP